MTTNQVALVLALVTASGPVAAAGDDDDDETEAPAPRAAVARTGKPVPFTREWLKPFFTAGAMQKAAESYRQEEWQAAEKGFLKAAAALPARSGERQAARYLAALAKANQGQWADAAALFEDLHRTYPRLAPYHAYNAARCRLRAGQAQAALEWAGKVGPGSVSDTEAALIRLDALRALGQWREAAVAAAAYVERFPGGPRRAEVLFKQAEALEKAAGAPPPAAAPDGGTPAGSTADRDPPPATDVTALYRRVWAESPEGGWGDRAAERLEAIATALPPKEAAALRTRTAGEWLSRGMVLFDKHRNTESEAALASALGAPGLDAGIECRARFHRAQSAWKARQRARAAPLFDEAEAACARAGNKELHARSLYQAGRCWAAAGDRAAATARYARVEAEHAGDRHADDARLRAAEVASEAGDEEAAAKLLADFPQRYPKGDMLNEALWRLALAAWRAERYTDAERWLDENLRLIPREEIWYAEGRALYWKARVLERRKDPKAARTFYARAVREYPLSVYALLALARLEAEPGERKTLIRELRRNLAAAAPPWRFGPRPLFGEAGFLRAVELARMGQGTDARRELNRLGLATFGDKSSGRTEQDDDDVLWITTVLLNKGRVWNASHSIPRHILTDYRKQYPAGLGAEKWRLSYPRAFPDLVAKNARANNIPEALQTAIMREESAFNPRIESYANAVGLTQLLLKTARRFSRHDLTRETLKNPARNLEYGSQYLAFLLNRFGRSAPLAVAGYNAGEGSVDRWLADRGELAMDEFMELIPYDQTRDYTKRVLASYFAYSWLYDAKAPVPGVPLAAAPPPPPKPAPKPAAKPAAKPGAKPPAKPAAKPATKPVAKAAAKK